ncbi:MAG TPA: anti-sigma factor [Acidobacteriaceae bacterium]|jgi:anti-sigma-K factor RskA|nr:anti-sigma factor [Acidobacteriaceae bacterium]
MEGSHITRDTLAMHAMRGLPADEEAAIGEHLANCVLCRWHLAEVSSNLALLGMSSGQRPLSDEERQRLLAQLARVPADEINEREQPLRQASRDEASSHSGPQNRAEGFRVKQDSSGRKSRGAAFWTGWGLAAGFAVATIALAVQNSSLNDTVQNESTLVTNLAVKASRAQQVLETLTSRRAEHVDLTPTNVNNEPGGRATYLPERGGLIFQANNLKPIPAEKTYELWLIPADGRAPIPAGLFRPDDLGTASLVMPHLPAAVPAKGFGVTIESAGGAGKPTLPNLLAGTVSNGVANNQ